MTPKAPSAPVEFSLPAGGDPLRVQACPDCRYSLNALPAEGVCPECGRPYDQETVVFAGWARDTLAHSRNTSRPRAVINLCWVFAFAWFISRGWRVHPATVAVIGVLLGIPALRRLTSGIAEPVRVRMNQAGCIQYDVSNGDGVVDTALAALDRFGLVAAYAVFVTVARGVGLYSHLFLSLLLLVFTAQLLLEAWVDRRARQEVAALPGGRALLPPGSAWITPAPTPWSAIREVSLIYDERRQRCRVTALRERHPWWRRRKEPVSADVHCTPEQVSALRSRIAAWRESAHHQKAAEPRTPPDSADPPASPG